MLANSESYGIVEVKRTPGGNQLTIRRQASTLNAAKIATERFLDNSLPLNARELAPLRRAWQSTMLKHMY